MTQLVPGTGPEGFDVAPRVLRTPFVDEWLGREADVASARERLSDELMRAAQEGRGHELVAITGEATGLVTEILPARQIVERMVADAEQTSPRSAGRPVRRQPSG